MQTIQLYSSLWHSFWAGNSFQDNGASNLIRKVQTTFVPFCPWFTHKVSYHSFLILHPTATFRQTPKPSSTDRSHIAQTQVLFPSLWWSSSMSAFSILQTKQSEPRERELMKQFIIFSLNEKLSILNAAQTNISCSKSKQASLNENTAVPCERETIHMDFPGITFYFNNTSSSILNVVWQAHGFVAKKIAFQHVIINNSLMTNSSDI